MSKYHNKPVIHDGIKFASTQEGYYYRHPKQFQGSETNKKIY